MSNLTAWQFLRELHKVCHFQTREGKKVGNVSASELKRLIQNKAVHANGEALIWDEPMDFPITSLVMFPNNENKRCTLF